MDRDLAFPELVGAMQARLGLRVKLTSEDPARERGRRRAVQGVVKPALESRSELVLEEDGSLAFRLADSAWYLLRPQLVTEAREEAGGRRLRVAMGEITWTIETFADQRRTHAGHLRNAG